VIADASLHNPLPALFRPYVWPYIFLYPVFAYIYFFRYGEFINGSEWTYVYLGTIMSTQALFWVMPFWNVEIRKRFETQPVSAP
jgi:cation-transporting ATPase 13A1